MEERVKELKEEKDLYHDIKALGDTEGGKRLVDALVSDVIGDLHWLSSAYLEKPEMELRSKCASLQAKLSLLGTIINAQTNEEDIDQLIEEALRG